ncbi:hypothetical protein ACQBAU_08250 [Propionibacteriaceae bacterium Y2011]|uniref:hypothetical protein n=1 Tax=Microlunatus sp. Y2014 TaxID=3418488 RepID=UPI003B44C0BA
MARRPSKHLRTPRPLSTGSFATTESRSDGDWQVRTVTGQAATKPYRCPGCQQQIGIGTPHVVVWPSTVTSWTGGGVDDRRHWHTSCWARRR